jgi:2-(1,2-epoxy-1,2-dihydrophenyl)acetyl-CoA isomerase
MPDYSGILCEVREGVGTITLNRPDSANALDHQTSMELVDALIRCEENREVRAVILTGTGRFFCAGADLKSFYTRPDGLKSGVSFIHVAASRIVAHPSRSLAQSMAQRPAAAWASHAPVICW